MNAGGGDQHLQTLPSASSQENFDQSKDSVIPSKRVLRGGLTWAADDQPDTDPTQNTSPRSIKEEKKLHENGKASPIRFEATENSYDASKQGKPGWPNSLGNNQLIFFTRDQARSKAPKGIQAFDDEDLAQHAQQPPIDESEDCAEHKVIPQAKRGLVFENKVFLKKQSFEHRSESSKELSHRHDGDKQDTSFISANHLSNNRVSCRTADGKYQLSLPVNGLTFTGQNSTKLNPVSELKKSARELYSGRSERDLLKYKNEKEQEYRKSKRDIEDIEKLKKDLKLQKSKSKLQSNDRDARLVSPPLKDLEQLQEDPPASQQLEAGWQHGLPQRSSLIYTQTDGYFGSQIPRTISPIHRETANANHSADKTKIFADRSIDTKTGRRDRSVESKKGFFLQTLPTDAPRHPTEPSPNRLLDNPKRAGNRMAQPAAGLLEGSRGRDETSPGLRLELHVHKQHSPVSHANSRLQQSHILQKKLFPVDSAEARFTVKSRDEGEFLISRVDGEGNGIHVPNSLLWSKLNRLLSVALSTDLGKNSMLSGKQTVDFDELIEVMADQLEEFGRSKKEQEERFEVFKKRVEAAEKLVESRIQAEEYRQKIHHFAGKLQDRYVHMPADFSKRGDRPPLVLSSHAHHTHRNSSSSLANPLGDMPNYLSTRHRMKSSISGQAYADISSPFHFTPFVGVRPNSRRTVDRRSTSTTLDKESKVISITRLEEIGPNYQTHFIYDSVRGPQKSASKKCPEDCTCSNRVDDSPASLNRELNQQETTQFTDLKSELAGELRKAVSHSRHLRSPASAFKHRPEPKEASRRTLTQHSEKKADEATSLYSSRIKEMISKNLHKRKKSAAQKGFSDELRSLIRK